MCVERVRPKHIVEKKVSPDILLINAPATYQQGVIPDDEVPSFGMLRIAVAAKKANCTPAYLDAHCNKMTVCEIDDVLHEIQPQLVGINPTSINIPEAQEIAELCARRGIPIILGGVHSSINPQEALDNDFPMAKAAVKGKGEHPTIHIISDIRRGYETEEPGVYYRNSSLDRSDFARYYPLDELPLIDQSVYVENPLLNKTVKINGLPIKLKEISLYETAGCPFQCTYCATPTLVGRGNGQKPYHRPQMDKILQSTEMALNLGANAVHFLDDMAFVNPDHFREFANGIDKMNTPQGFYWRGMTRAPTIADKCTDEDLKILANSGCWRIAMGVESGNNAMLKRIKKGITIEQVKRAVARLRDAGIPQVKAFFIMGFPNESAKQLQETYNFVMELKSYGLTNINIFQFKPYPGTLEWQRLKDENPEVLKNLYYIRKGNPDGTIVGKNEAKDAKLPDDLKIAQVPSGEINNLILQTLNDFYG